MGQNCAGPERFFVCEKAFEEFCDGVVKVVREMKVGASLGDEFVDCGSICMGPNQMKHYQKLVDDAVAKGAKLLHGGYTRPPTVLCLRVRSTHPPSSRTSPRAR